MDHSTRPTEEFNRAKKRLLLWYTNRWARGAFSLARS